MIKQHPYNSKCGCGRCSRRKALIRRVRNHDGKPRLSRPRKQSSTLKDFKRKRERLNNDQDEE